jgi:hypothetical protein
VVFEKPVIDERELVRAIDPVHGHVAAFGRLQRAGILTTGVATDDTRNRRLYCSLNRDTVSAVRHGNNTVAQELRSEAERIEAETITPWVHALKDLGVGETSGSDIDAPTQLQGDWVNRLLFGAEPESDDEIAEPIWRAANEIAEVRSRYGQDDVGIGFSAGRLWRIGETFGEVRAFEAISEGSFVFLTSEILSAGLRLGDPIIVRHEQLAPGVLLTNIERGVEKVRRYNRLSGEPLPAHLEELLDASSLSSRTHDVPPLRRVA